MKVTACLITWKRQYNIPKIIESLQQWSFIDQIYILDNSKGENIINYGRYVLAERASNSIIYTQDDDCIVRNIDEIYGKFLTEPHKLCHSGIEDYQKVIKDNIFGEAQMAIVGWGAFLNKGWIRLLDRYIEKFGKDYCFYRETDRILSILLKQHHNFVLGDITQLPGKDDKDALCQQVDHLKYKKLAIERALSLI